MQKNNYPGKFIVFEGLDGSGQSTQGEKLVDFLNSFKHKFRLGLPGAHLTKEPTNNLIGGLIRGQLTHNWKSTAECLQLLFAADRAHHLEKEVIPLLKKGIWVISDRYFFSTIAYGSLEISDWQWLKVINKPFLLPDLSLFLKVSPSVCTQRMKKARFGMELFEKKQILEKVWQGYARLAKEFNNIHMINGEQTVGKVFEDVKKVITKIL